MNEQNSYYAFISYNSADEKWAKWLQHNLEYYHIPSALCKEYPELPKKIRPIFWYKQDLSGTKLKKALNNELSSSKYLIVICSPDSAKADWVNDEVIAFIEQGKGDRIIPFIVAGTPHAKNPDEECFPPSLRNLTRDEEIRGIDVRRKEGKSHALVDVIATMFGVRFDVLWQRHERRRKRILNIWIAVASVFLLCALGIYDYNRTKVEYYADFVDRWGVAEGIIPLDDDQVSHRHHSYKFEYTRVPFGERDFYSWRLKRVSLVNSKGVISDYVPDHHAFFYPIQEFEYTDGYVTDIINRDTYKRVVMRYSVKDDYEHNVACLIDMEGKEKRQGSAYLGASTTVMVSDANSNNTKSKIKRFHYTRNDKGYITKITYHANDGDDLLATAVSDNNNIYGKQYQIDSLGRTEKISYINSKGEIATDKLGIAHIQFVYDELGEVEIIEYHGIDNTPSLNEMKYAKQVYFFDSYGNIVSQLYQGINGEPCFNSKKIHKIEVFYNSFGYTTEYRFLDFDGNLSCNSDGYAVCKILNDNLGRISEQSYFDQNRMPCYNMTGVSKFAMAYDSKNRRIRVSVFDTEGSPCISKDAGVHMSQIEYNNDNYITQYSFYDVNKEPSYSPILKYSKSLNFYNQYNDLITIQYFDENNTPCCTGDHVCSINYEYDVRGNIIREEYFDAEGNLCLSSNGAAILKTKYDNYGNIIEESYWGTDSKPIYINHHTSVRYEYTANGLVRELRYYDEENNLCLNNNWVAIIRYEYDTYGNIIGIMSFDADNKPCISKDMQCAYLEKTYDARGNVVKEVFRDINDIPTMTNSGYSIAEYQFDNKNRIIEYKYYDNLNRPININNGSHTAKIVYDDRGNILKKIFIDSQGRGAHINGFSQIAYTYDEKNNLVKTQYLDIQNNKVDVAHTGYSTELKKYDKFDRLISFSYLDSNGSPCWVSSSNPSGFISQVEYSYDSRNNVIKCSYFDPDGRPTMAAGSSKLVINYDEHNRMVERTFYGNNEELIPGFYGKPIERYTYFNNGKESSIALHNSDSTLFIMIKYQYDKIGNMTDMEIRDSSGNLTVANILYLTEGPMTKIKRYWNEKHQEYRREFYDTSGALVNNNDGYSIIEYEYDKFGNEISKKIFDNNNHPVNSKTQKWHRLEMSYNNKGLIETSATYDANNRYVNLPWSGCCKLISVYDIYGNIDHNLSVNYTAINGNAVDTRNIHPEDYIEQTEENKIANGECVILQVEKPGLFLDNGLEGAYFLLEWNNWSIYDDLVAFSEEFATSKDLQKHLVLLPYNSDEKYGDIIEITLPVGTLGVRVMDYLRNDVYNECVQKYERWQQNR